MLLCTTKAWEPWLKGPITSLKCLYGFTQIDKDVSAFHWFISAWKCTLHEKEKNGRRPLELNWTSGKNMDRYLQRTICRSCSGGDKMVYVSSAFCGPGERMAAQIRPDSSQTPVAPGSAVTPEQQITPQSTPRFQLRVTLYPSQLSQPCPCPEWGKPHGQQNKYSCRRALGEKGSRPSKRISLLNVNLGNPLILLL